MPVCVPIKELKNTADFSRTVRESASPVIVTRNGADDFVAMTLEQYEALSLEAARARLYEAVDRGEDDIRCGRTVDARDAMERLRARHGL